MSDCSLYLTYNITHEGKILKTDKSCIDVEYLMSQYLDCSENPDNGDELDVALINASERKLIEISKSIWSSGYIYNILMEETSDYMEEVSQFIADDLNNPDLDDYSAEGVYESMEWIIIKSELVINGKIYDGK